MIIEEWIKWILGRPNKKARQRRLFEALDHNLPDWEVIIHSSGFNRWAHWTHPVTKKTRFDILKTLSISNYDGISTARLLKLAPSEIELLVRKSTLCYQPNMFLGYGSIIDKRYEVMGVLGRGGFGEVVRVYSHEVEEFFALKLLRGHLLADMDARAQFMQEANLWIKLGYHSNIVHAEFVDKLGDETVILMEIIEGNAQGLTSLQDHITKTKKLTLEQIVSFSVGICDGMTHAYSSGIKAHRDLKPDNVLIEQGKVAKVTDFGISRLVQSSLDISEIAGQKIMLKPETNDTIMGTFPYMAPEQFLSATSCDQRSDIYSFGIMLYEMIAKGRWPYGDYNNLLKNVAKENVPYFFYMLHLKSKPKFLFNKLFKIAKACLQKDPQQRPESFQIVKHMLLDEVPLPSAIHKTYKSKVYFDPWELGRKASSLYRLGSYEDALILFDEILDKFPLGKQWEFDKALTLSKLDRIDEALDLYSKILDRDPSHLGALVNKGLLCQQADKLEEAIQLYTIAIEHHPDDIDVLTNIGNVSFKLKNYDAAAMYYTRTIKLDSGYATGWYNLGLACQENYQTDYSKRCFANFLERADPLDTRRDYVKKILNQYS